MNISWQRCRIIFLWVGIDLPSKEISLCEYLANITMKVKDHHRIIHQREKYKHKKVVWRKYIITKPPKMHIPGSKRELIKCTTFSLLLNSEVSLSSFSRNTKALTAERLKPPLSLAGEEPPDEAITSFMDFVLLPALVKRYKHFMEDDKIIVSLS